MADKVLVVDDEPDIRELLSDFLNAEGYEVILASNGEQAVELAEREDPDLILLDINMPGIDGIEACSRLKEEEKTGSIPIIIASAYREAFTEALQAGADDLVVKPFHLTELSVRIKSILHIRHLTDERDRAIAYTLELQKNLPRE